MTPITGPGRFVASLLVLVGILLTSILVGSITLLMSPTPLQVWIDGCATSALLVITD